MEKRRRNASPEKMPTMEMKGMTHDSMPDMAMSHMTHDSKPDMDMSHMTHDHMPDMDKSHMTHDSMPDMDMSQMNHSDMMNHGGHMMHMGNLSQKLKVAIVLMIPLLLISPVAGFTLLKFPGSVALQLILGSVIFFYCGRPFFSGARGELKSRKPAMMMLITMGITVAYLYSVYASFMILTGFDKTAMNFWFELSTLIVIMLIGHIIEMRAVMSAGDALKDLASLLPKKAHLKSGEDIEISSLKVGDVLIVKENEKVPADGEITSTTLAVPINESMITGESRAVAKEAGDKVYGGSQNQNTPFEMRVTTTGKDSFLSQVAKLVQNAQENKSNLENMADRVAGYLFWAALVVGLASLIIWTITANFAFALLMAVSVFIIACPHALGLAVPLVVSRLTTISSKNGLLIQNRTALETINKVKYALMDKTGTLTDGKFVVRKIAAFGNAEKTDVLQIMAAIESNSTHPIAVSIVEAAGELKYTALNVENQPGVGLTADVNGRHYQIASLNWLHENHISIGEHAAEISEYLNLGLTVSVLLSSNKPYGFVALGDSPKADAVRFIKGLIAHEITPVMLTGDNQATAEKISAALGISEFRAELKPEDKAKIVKEYQKKGAVLFVGDGVNDSPALATADIGFAIGAGTSVAIGTADVVLVNSNPSSVLDMIDIAKRMLRKMKQNLWFGAGYNIIAIPVAAGILYPAFHIMVDPLAAAVLMSLSTVVVAINAMRLNYTGKKQE